MARRASSSAATLLAASLLATPLAAADPPKLGVFHRDVDGDGQEERIVIVNQMRSDGSLAIFARTYRPDGSVLSYEQKILPPNADLTGDGIVDSKDLALVVGAWGGDGPADLNLDGVVDREDLGVVLGQFGTVVALPRSDCHAMGCVEDQFGNCHCGGGGGPNDPDDGDPNDPAGLPTTDVPTDGDDGGQNPGNHPPPGGGGDPQPPPEEPPEDDDDDPCEFTIEGPKFITLGESAEYTLSIGGADAIEWTVQAEQGVVQVDSPTLTESTLDVTALQTPGIVTLAAVVTVDGEMCMDDLQVAVGEIDMVAHRPQTEFLGFQLSFTVPDGDEEDPGAGIRLNGDDDNVNGTPDFDDRVSPLNQDPRENDLLKVSLTLEPYPAPAGVKYFLKRSTDVIKVWTESGLVLDNTNDEELKFNGPIDPTVLWIEAVEPGVSVLTLEVRDDDTDEVYASDSIRFYTFTSAVIVLSGEGRFGAPFLHGTTEIARLLHTQGYDAYLFNEEVVGHDGSGPPYFEVISAVEERAVDKVAIVGYSHGGGSTHDLAERLQIQPPNKPFTIPFTGYIDAIEQGDSAMTKDVRTTPETRLPPGTLFHINLWQPVPWQTPLGPVNGAPVPGSAIDINVNAAPPGGWGLLLDHGTIDNDPQVRAFMIQGVINNVSR